jgi:hypothetical protein
MLLECIWLEPVYLLEPGEGTLRQATENDHLLQHAAVRVGYQYGNIFVSFVFFL